jgi:hypothetical protein
MIGRKRKQSLWAGMLVVLAAPLLARADFEPMKMTFEPQDSSVYAPPEPFREDQGSNLGGVNLDFKFSYMSDYVYRGVDRSSFIGRSKKPNLQFEGTVEFNTGKLPHPFFGIFTNLFNNDPVSRFQEIRPYAGFNWNLRPILVSFGVTSYIYPERDAFNTSEVWVKATLDDSLLFRTEKPVFSPYGFAAYDYDKNNGFYLEAGLSHDFPIEDWGLTLTVVGDVAYISHIRQVFIFVNPKSTGFQHYDAGLIGTYQLNKPLHVSQRFGEINLKGYLYYTDGIDKQLTHAAAKVWGGFGVEFKY